MIYELRTYESYPGKMQALQDRFADHTIRLFEQHGITVVGFWTTVIGDSSDRLIYMLAYDDMEHREKAFSEFVADPERQRIFVESEKDGPLIQRTTNEILRPTPFSPMQ